MDLCHLPYFHFWCQRVIPLVFDDTLSYLQVLCKVVDYLNALIKDNNMIIDNIKELEKELQIVQDWINNFDTSYAEQIIADYLATMIFLEISDSGYIIYYIPEKWTDVTFNTTGLDISVPCQDEYGHLVLSY